MAAVAQRWVSFLSFFFFVIPFFFFLVFCRSFFGVFVLVFFVALFFYITISCITISSITMVRQGARVGGWAPFFVLSIMFIFFCFLFVLFCFSLIYFRKAIHVVRKHCFFLLVCACTADYWQKRASQDDDHFPSKGLSRPGTVGTLCRLASSSNTLRLVTISSTSYVLSLWFGSSASVKVRLARSTGSAWNSIVEPALRYP
ncbi:hypothetical protein BDV41DRAFT_555458, partial [Aspergillus transmontanensis]